MPSDQPRILVTGGTGFAGSHLIEELLASGYTNIYSTTFSPPPENVKFLADDHYIQVDLSNGEATQALLKTVKPDWIFHLASFAYVGKSFEKARELFTNNINLQLNLLDGVKAICPQARVLSIGSAEEYGVVDLDLDYIDEHVSLNPVNPYAVSKTTQDLLSNSYYLSYKLNIVRARPFNHIGTRQTGDFAVPSFVKQIVEIEQGKKQTLEVGNLQGIRDFTSVKDMVRAYIVLLEKGAVGDVYNIGSGTGIQMQEIVNQLVGLSTVPITVEQDEARLRPLDVPKLIADNRKIQSLGWELQISINEELEKIIEEWRART